MIDQGPWDRFKRRAPFWLALPLMALDLLAGTVWYVLWPPNWPRA